MARQVQIALIDDIDGGEATESISFSVGSDHYEMDLNDQNAEKFRAALAPFIEVARNSKQASSGEAPAIRAWAKENNIKVNARGRLNADVVEAYQAAQRKGGRSRAR
ncbi:histone-like nucleoid-structuring protein Lsr2 [Glutamicibacter uratoxydans]|uniref:histone-like nucleoid-structuring protein Lsr2 n=1 Tax=Glutamicibacter uratoxydans TaxID=43667 RepID=UPI003D6FEC87